MSLNFSANLNCLFKEKELIDRFQSARENGFKAFELQNPYELAPDVIAMKKEDMVCDLINIYCGPDKYGCAALPVHEAEFYASIDKVNLYFPALNFKKLHILSGEKSPSWTPEDHLSKFIENLKNLIEMDYFENINVTAVIEPICNDVIPNYYLNSFDLAIDIINSLQSSQVKLLLDIFHLHKITSNVAENLERLYPYAGHIQVSQDPGRIEPFAENGKIDYVQVFDFLRQRDHKDYIGLEYFPSGSTVDSLKWMKDYI